VTQQVGLDLILPVAALLPLERRIQWHAQMEIPRKVLDSLADGAESLAEALLGGKVTVPAALLAKLPKRGPLAALAAIPTLAGVAKLAGEQIKEINAKARKDHNYLTAMLTQFKLDLDKGVTDKLLIRSLK
jgi:hypothetical protein